MTTAKLITNVQQIDLGQFHKLLKRQKDVSLAIFNAYELSLSEIRTGFRLTTWDKDLITGQKQLNVYFLPVSISSRQWTGEEYVKCLMNWDIDKCFYPLFRIIKDANKVHVNAETIESEHFVDKFKRPIGAKEEYLKVLYAGKEILYLSSTTMCPHYLF